MRHWIAIVISLIVACNCFAQHAGAIALSKAKFSLGQDVSWISSAFNDESWKDIQTSEVWQNQGYPDYHGYAWYRIHIVIPSSLKQKAFWKDSLRLFLAHVNDADETYLNGALIGKTGSFPDDKEGYVSKWPAIREYHVAISSKTIHWDEENIIAIKVFDGGGTGGIFMGKPFLDILEKTDGITITIQQDSLRYEDENANVPLNIINHFNTPFEGDCKVIISDIAIQKTIIKQNVSLHLEPFEKKTISFAVPNQSGISLSYSVTQKNSTLTLSKNEAIPYILTPAPSLHPRINSAAVIGVHPHTPILFKIAASGQKPMQYSILDLPKGLEIDNNTGIITGSLADSSNYKVHVVVSNAKGKAQQMLTIKAGSELALTPTMGWNSWNCWGINVSEDKVKSSAQALIDKGLTDYGWSYVNIDDGWQAAHRTKDSMLMPNEKFKDMNGLGNWLHSKGLKFGIYSSPGPKTCGGFLGSYRNEAKDAAMYADWGIDYLKYDWCSYDGVVKEDTSLAAYIKPYAIMDSALQISNRAITYSLCQYGMKDVWKWGRSVHGQSWRTTEDIEDTWESMSKIGFEQYPLYLYVGPGHWIDPDMMIVGQVGWGENLHPSRLTPDEQYTHVSLWCMLSAPLLIGCDLERLDAFTLNLLTNSEVLAIDQDVLGKQAQRIINRDSSQVWVKDLADGSKVVAIFNIGTNYQNIKVSWKELGLKPLQSVRDVWRQKNIGNIANEYSTVVPPHGVMLIKVKPDATSKMQ